MSEPELGARIAALEVKVAGLYQQLGLQEPAAAGGLSPEVQQALAAGNKIEAIRIQREQTGMGLAEAKAVVEGGAAGPRIIT